MVYAGVRIYKRYYGDVYNVLVVIYAVIHTCSYYPLYIHSVCDICTQSVSFMRFLIDFGENVIHLHIVYI